MLACSIAVSVAAQGTTYQVALPAVGDAFAAATGGFLLAIPGVADDFVLAADGQFEQRPDGTARLSAFLRRVSSIDRELFLQLEFSGRLAPGSVGHPPAGSPVVTLLPGAYVPLGPIAPGTFVYYTQVTGSLAGVHSYGGARILASQAGAAQLGIGANNRNVSLGLSLDLTLQVVHPAAQLPFLPTGPAQLRATLAESASMCVTHVDAEPQASGGAWRAAVTIPGVAGDYVFPPVGAFVEEPNGSATLHGIVRRQSDYEDRWHCQIVFGNRVDPRSVVHPPAGSPLLQLLPAMYATQGGPIDAAQWRYYTQVAGTLTGEGINAGGQVALAATGAAQVGLGAAQGNPSFGLMAVLAPALVTQPTGRTLVLAGDVVVQANVDQSCLLPTPHVLTGQLQTLDNVTELPAVYTGTDLGWIEQVAIGSTIIASTDARRWFLGNVQVRNHQTVEVFVPQGLAAGAHAITLLDRVGMTPPMTLTLQNPAAPTLRTESTMLPFEAQHWVLHQGDLTGPVLSYVMLSTSNAPSILPGQIDLSIGNQFASLLVFPGALHDAAGLLTTSIPSMPPVFLGQRVYYQAALIELTSAQLLPLATSGVWVTDY